jgi:arabinofuranosyltransferase
MTIDRLRVYALKLSSPGSLRYLPMIVLAALAGVIGFALQPNVLYDDAAISFRYADRIVAGHGFTYNDHEHVLGASNPLWTLLLALLHAVGVNLELAARGLALVLFIGCILLAMHVAERLSTPLGGILAGVLLAIDLLFRDTALSGMESVLAVAFRLAVVASLLHGTRRTLSAQRPQQGFHPGYGLV